MVPNIEILPGDLSSICKDVRMKSFKEGRGVMKAEEIENFGFCKGLVAAAGAQVVIMHMGLKMQKNPKADCYMDVFKMFLEANTPTLENYLSLLPKQTKDAPGVLAVMAAGEGANAYCRNK